MIRPANVGPRDALGRRARNEARARRLLGQAIAFVPHPSFDDPASRAAILGPAPATERPAGDDRAAEPDRLGAAPPLTRDQEVHLFRRMNYLKSRAVALRQGIDPARPRPAELDRLERLQAEAQRTRDQIVRANLRLVVALARRRQGRAPDVAEQVSEGVLALFRAVERFDWSRGTKFSTYATAAIKNALAVAARRRDRGPGRLITGLEGLSRAAVARDDERVQQQVDEQRRAAVARLLDRLDDRERRVIAGRYGLDGAGARTLEQLGQELAITKERVRQIESRAVDKLRGLAGAEERELAMA